MSNEKKIIVMKKYHYFYCNNLKNNTNIYRNF